MGNKTIQSIICVLFIITFACGVVGYINKDKIEKTPVPETQTPTDVTPTSSIDQITYNNNENILDSISSVISNYEFVKANKTFNSGYVKADIQDNVIKIGIDKAGINTANDDDPNVIEYTVSEISSPVGVQAEISSEEGNIVKAYVISETNKLYFITFKADPRYHDGIVIYEYVVNNIESFTIVSDPLNDTPVDSGAFVIFKTEDSYYTDYKFNEGEITITKIGNINSGVPVVNEMPNEEETQMVEEENNNTTEELNNEENNTEELSN